LADAIGDIRDAFFRKAEAVDRGFGEAVLLGFGYIGCVGFENFGEANDQLVGHRHKDSVFGFRIKPGQRTRGGAGVFADVVDLVWQTAHGAKGV
jgi:hypothetical protein